MSKFISSESLDGMLNNIKNNGDKLYVCALQPTTFADAGTKKLAEVAMAGGDYTLSSVSNDRRLAVAAKTGISTTVTGTADHLAIVDTTNSKLLAVTTLTSSQAVTIGGLINTPTWNIDNKAPV